MDRLRLLDSAEPLEDSIHIDSLRRALPLFLVLLFSLALRLPSLHVPLERDEGGFAYIAAEWHAHILPYREAFDNKPPLLYGAYRAAIALFGSTAEGVHLFFILLGLLEAALFYKIARHWMEENAALAATIAFSLLAAEPTYAVGTAANASNVVLLPLILSAYWLPTSAWLAGLCLGAAAMTKQTAALQGLAFGVWLIWTKRRFKEPAIFALSALVIPAAFSIYFWANGAWSDFIGAVWTYNLQHTSGVLAGGQAAEGFQQLFDNVRALAPAEIGIWFLALVGLISTVIPRCPWRGIPLTTAGPQRYGELRKLQVHGSPTGALGDDGKKLALLWLAASLASLCVSLRFLSHYFVELAPALALAVGWSWGEIKNRKVFFVLLLVPYLIANWQFLIGGSPEAFSRAAYEGNYFAEAVPVALHIEETTAPSDRILIFGSEPEILFLAHRPSATRHVFFYPLTIERATDSARAEARRFQEEAVREVESRWPTMIVWVNNPLSFLAGSKTDTLILNKGLEWIRSGRYAFDGAVIAGPNQPTRYFLSPEAVAKFDPAQIKQATYVLYRLKEPDGK